MKMCEHAKSAPVKERFFTVLCDVYLPISDTKNNSWVNIQLTADFPSCFQ